MSQQEHVEYSQPSEDRLFEHTYDGIQEYDNPLPGWWKFLFYVTIVFSAFYFFHYHMGGLGKTIHDDYDQELSAYAALKAKLEHGKAKVPIGSQLAELRKDQKALAEGKGIYMGKGTCFTCHGAHGEGGIGPNLTDAYWIHGGSDRDIFRVVREGGRPGKGMLAWGNILKPQELLLVTAYITTLQGTKPANAKAPEQEAKLYSVRKNP